MLGKKVLSVEVIVDSFVRWCVWIVVGVTRAYIASVEAELKVLNGDMALPFVLGT